jgi:D-sedoheptulose 7-phosphate isomerase
MNTTVINSLEDARIELENFLKDSLSIDSISESAITMAETLKSGHKIISCGNGGSLCDATHFTEELTGRYRDDRRPLPAISINDPAYITCVGNDYSFDDIYSRFIEAVGKEGDVLLAISTSGQSENINNAAIQAHKLGIKVIALTAKGDHNKLCNYADIAICAPYSPHSDRIQEIHIKVIHILIEQIEELLKNVL